jgi:hypothetical protein
MSPPRYPAAVYGLHYPVKDEEARFSRLILRRLVYVQDRPLYRFEVCLSLREGVCLLLTS